MKLSFTILALFGAISMMAQRGDELLVYSVKGKVTATYQNVESPVKIGKVLKPGTTLKTDKDARLTMVCKQGKPLSIIKEGVYPISRWKDSCRNTAGSITSNYFQYIWSELYRRSEEYSEDLDQHNNLAVVRGEDDRYADYPEGMVVVEFSPGLDTLNFTGNDFPLSWLSYDYNGKYQFSIYTSKDRKLVFKDSVDANGILISRFANKLKPGTSYAWTVTANANTGVIRRRILHYVPQKKLAEYTQSIAQPVGIVEDSAASFFRIGYLMEKKHFLAEAFSYYQKAAAADATVPLYRDKLSDFRYEYKIDELEPLTGAVPIPEMAKKKKATN